MELGFLSILLFCSLQKGICLSAVSPLKKNVGQVGEAIELGGTSEGLTLQLALVMNGLEAMLSEFVLIIIEIGED